MNEQPTFSEAPVVPSELRTLHEAITATLKAGLPQIKHVEAYPILKEGMKLPALLYAATGFAPGGKPGDGRLRLKVTFEALILLESSRAMAPLQAAILTGKLMQLLDEQYWGVDGVDMPEGVQAMPSAFVPELARCTGWSVLWQQDVFLGDTAWPWEDEPAGSLVFEPEDGPGEVSDGVELQPGVAP